MSLSFKICRLDAKFVELEMLAEGLKLLMVSLTNNNLVENVVSSKVILIQL